MSDSFINPYAFIRPLPPVPADRVTVLGRIEPPPHDRYVGLSGTIECEIETATPVFVADSQRVEARKLGTRKGQQRWHYTYRTFRAPDGRPAIPGSTLRGVIRSVFESSTGSCMFHVHGDRSLRYTLNGQPVLHPWSVSEMIPGHLRGCSEIARLCPTCRTFGWVADSAPSDQEPPAYRGRVQFDDAWFDDGALKRPNSPVSLRILAAPKPSYTWFYLADDRGEPLSGIAASAGRRPGRLIRGRKVFRYQPDVPDTHSGGDPPPRTDQNRSIRDWIDAEAAAPFRVRFHNLAPAELGALVWALELPDECVHRIGYGKPLGFGSAWIHVTGVSLHTTRRYTSAESATELADDEIAQLLAAFASELTTLHEESYPGVDFADLPAIADIRALLEPRDPLASVTYPPGGFKWFQMNQHDDDGRNLALLEATADPRLPKVPRRRSGSRPRRR